MPVCNMSPMKPIESATRIEVRAAAARLFRKVGFNRATVRDIAKAVGLQSGSIFYHFDTKEDILVEVMREGMRQFMAVAQAPLPAASTPQARLRQLLVGHLNALHSRNSDELSVVLSEWRSLSPRSRQQIVILRDAVDATWDRALGELEAEGLVHGEIRILRLAILGAANWSLQWYDERGAMTIEQLADELLGFFLPAAVPAARPKARARGSRPR